MKRITDYLKVFETLVTETQKYITENGLKVMILGISGGIDSTVCAAICHEVSKRTGIPLIGRSLPSQHNKEGETSTADLVGKAFCNDYKIVPLDYIDTSIWCVRKEDFKQNKLANGNIQARLRMIYLYNLASIKGGLVMDTDNLTENNLGYFTIHGDVGDFNPIGGLWKTEVFELAEYLVEYYSEQYKQEDLKKLVYQNITPELPYKVEALSDSLQLKPTAGLGITNSDLDEIGAESYEQVDSILQEILAWKKLAISRGDVFQSKEEMKNVFLEEQQMLDIPIKIIMNVTNRHFASEFKRSKLPIVVNRNLYI